MIVAAILCSRETKNETQSVIRVYTHCADDRLRTHRWKNCSRVARIKDVVGSFCTSKACGGASLGADNRPTRAIMSSMSTCSSIVHSLGNVLKSLIFQALRKDPLIVSQDPRLGNIQSFQAQHTTAEWIDLAALVLSKIKECFIVVETEDLLRQRGHGVPMQTIIDTFSHIFEEAVKAGCTMKLLLVSYGVRMNLGSQAGPASTIVVSLNPPLPVVRRTKQPLVPQFKLGSGRNQLQPRLTAR